MSDRRIWPVFMPKAEEPWAPSVDVYRGRSGWVLKFDLAGVQIEDVSVTVRGRHVSISGVRRDTVVEEGSSYYAMEISYNRFERTIEMPSRLDHARVALEARNGILLVRMITEGNDNA